MQKVLAIRVHQIDEKTLEVGPFRIENSENLRKGEILDWGVNAESPLGVVDYFVVQRSDGCFYLSYTTLPREVAVQKHGPELIDREFPLASRIPIVVETAH